MRREESAESQMREEDTLIFNERDSKRERERVREREKLKERKKEVDDVTDEIKGEKGWLIIILIIFFIPPLSFSLSFFFSSFSHSSLFFLIS